MVSTANSSRIYATPIISIHATALLTQLGQSAATTIGGVTLVNLNQPTKMDLICTHDQNSGTPYIDPGAEIAAY